MIWAEVTYANVLSHMPTDVLTAYNAWLVANPDRADRLATITANTVREFRDAIKSNPANVVYDDEDYLPQSCIRHCENIIIFTLGMEMGLTLDTAGASARVSADVFLRQIPYGRWNTTTNDDADIPTPRYSVPATSAGQVLAALVALLLGAATARGGWIKPDGAPTYDTQILTTYVPAAYSITAQSLFYHLQGINAAIDTLSTATASPQSYGTDAGEGATGTDWFAAGKDAGRDTTGDNWLAVGKEAGKNVVGSKFTAIGLFAGLRAKTNQWTAVGPAAGRDACGEGWVAVGHGAGEFSTGELWTAVGPAAGYFARGNQYSAYGYYAAFAVTGMAFTAIGTQAGMSAKGSNWVAVGKDAGVAVTGELWSAVGKSSGAGAAGNMWAAYGYNSGTGVRGDGWIAIGADSAISAKGTNWTAVGRGAGAYSTGTRWGAFGDYTGYGSTGDYWVALGNYAGRFAVWSNSTAVGQWAGRGATGTNRLYIDVYDVDGDPGADGGTNDVIFSDNGNLNLGRTGPLGVGKTNALRGSWKVASLALGTNAAVSDWPAVTGGGTGGTGWTNLSITGTGNAITGATAAADTLTLQRGEIEGGTGGGTVDGVFAPYRIPYAAEGVTLDPTNGWWQTMDIATGTSTLSFAACSTGTAFSVRLDIIGTNALTWSVADPVVAPTIATEADGTTKVLFDSPIGSDAWGAKRIW